MRALTDNHKKYRVIYADPPWRFSSKEVVKYQGKRFSALEKHYATEPIGWIAELPVAQIADTDAALFLWSTDAHLPDAVRVMQAWGFKYVTVAFAWEKVTRLGNPVKVLGSWTMKSVELCLFGTKGRMLKYKRINNIDQLVRAERTRHSAKPPEVRNRIEQMFGQCNRLELFARGRVPGWDVWGDESID